jgi:hypothetical protein
MSRIEDTSVGIPDLGVRVPETRCAPVSVCYYAIASLSSRASPQSCTITLRIAAVPLSIPFARTHWLLWVHLGSVPYLVVWCPQVSSSRAVCMTRAQRKWIRR